MGSTDNDNRVTADDGSSTTKESVITSQDPALPRELILRGVLTSNYSGVGNSTFLGKCVQHGVRYSNKILLVAFLSFPLLVSSAMSQHVGPKANLADFLWSRRWDLEHGVHGGGTYWRQLFTWETLQTRRTTAVSIVIIVIVTVRLQTQDYTMQGRYLLFYTFASLSWVWHSSHCRTHSQVWSCLKVRDMKTKRCKERHCIQSNLVVMISEMYNCNKRKNILIDKLCSSAPDLLTRLCSSWSRSCYGVWPVHPPTTTHW